VKPTESRAFSLRNETVTIRGWTSQDDLTQRKWPPYNDPCNSLWNIPRNVSFYDSLLAFGNASSQRHSWAIDNRNGQLVGRISLRDIDQRNGRGRLGISLGSPYVGQGLGTAALSLFFDYYFGSLNFQVMMLDVAAFNQRAVRCYQHLGFCVVSDEWRKSSSHACLKLLDDPANRHLQAHFRHERSMVWVQFFEMELYRDTWRAHDRAYRYPHSETSDRADRA
jgi:RimJ/RimL family protein N-acetyltransferase